MASSTQRAKFDLKTICDVLGSVEHKWFKMGIQLGISRSKLQEFKKDEDPFSAVIEYWLRGNVINSDSPVSWETIVAALKSRYLDEPGLAEEVSMTYCQLEDSNFTKPKARDGQRENKEPEKATAASSSSSQPSSSDCPEGAMDPGVRTELERILERNVQEIIAKYATYVDCLRIAIIEKEISADDLRSFLLSLSATSKSGKGQKPSLLSDKSSKLENCSTVTAIFNILITECTSFLNYNIYGFILKRYGICDDREEFKYSEHLQDYITKHKISEFAKVNPLLKPGNGSKDLIVKFDIETTCSLAKLTDLKKLIADIMEINSLALEIIDIEEGCVIVTFFIPASLADVLFTPHTVFSSEQEEKLRAAAVMWFKCNGHTFHFGKSKVKDTALEILKKQLTCSICLGTYTDPKLLQCQHACCQQCLIGLVQQDQQGQPTLTCPTCRQVTPVPASGVAGLQTDFRANQLLDIISSGLEGPKFPAATSDEEVKPKVATVTGLPAATSNEELKPKVILDADPKGHTPLSPEYRTLVSVTGKLISEISADPVTVASKLASKGLIPPLASPSLALLSTKEKEVMAGELVTQVENEVKHSPETFEVFVSVLSDFPWLQGLIRQESIQMMRKDLEEMELKDQDVVKEKDWHAENTRLRMKIAEGQNLLEDLSQKIAEEQNLRQGLEVKLLQSEQQLLQLKQMIRSPGLESHLTPHTSSSSASEFPWLERETCHLQIPKGHNPRKHGWLPVFMVISFKMKKLLIYEKEDDMEEGGPITTYEFSQIHSVRTLKAGEHETYRIKQSNFKKVLLLSYIDQTYGSQKKLLSGKYEEVMNFRGHQFVEVYNHTPTNCDVCSKPLPWSVIRVVGGSYECERCHLKCHKEHADTGDMMQPCIGGESDVKRLLLLIKNSELREKWLGLLSQISITRDDGQDSSPAQVSVKENVKGASKQSVKKTATQQLLAWCQHKTKSYENVEIKDFHSSWSDGLAFCAILHSYLPDKIPYEELTAEDKRRNFTLAFQVAKDEGIPEMLDVDDMMYIKITDAKSIMTFLVTIYQHFNG